MNPNRLTYSLKNLAALGMAFALAWPHSATGQSPTTLLSTRFEEPDYLAGVPLVFQDSWVGIPPLSPLAAVISSDHPRQGKQSVRVQGRDMISGPFAPYDAIGSYRRPLNYDVTSHKPIVVIGANVLLETDQPATVGDSPADDFFSMTLAARSGDDENLAEIGLSSSGSAVSYGFNALPGAVPLFKKPIAFNEWHRVEIELDFSGETTVVSYYVNDERVGVMPTSSTSKVLLRAALVVYALPDGGDDVRANYTARFDNLRVSVHGTDD